jgi:hypothetical protein
MGSSSRGNVFIEYMSILGNHLYVVSDYDSIKVMCIDVYSGEVVWYDWESYFYFDDYGAVLSDNKLIIQGKEDYAFAVNCYNALNGTLLWEYKEYEWVWPTSCNHPIIGNQKAYFAADIDKYQHDSGCKIFSLNLETGEKIDEYLFEGEVNGILNFVLANQDIYVIFDGYDNDLYKIDTNSGSKETIVEDIVYAESLSYSNDHLLYTSDTQTLHCVNSYSKDESWSFEYYVYWGNFRGLNAALAYDKVYQIGTKITGEGSNGFHEYSPVIFCLGDNGNTAPHKPVLDGPEDNIKLNQKYTYTTSTNDSENHPIYYKFWNGEEYSDWKGPYNSGEEVSFTTEFKEPDEVLNDHHWLHVIAMDDPNSDGSFFSDGLLSSKSNELMFKIEKRKSSGAQKLNIFFEKYSCFLQIIQEVLNNKQWSINFIYLYL